MDLVRCSSKPCSSFFNSFGFRLECDASHAEAILQCRGYGAPQLRRERFIEGHGLLPIAHDDPLCTQSCVPMTFSYDGVRSSMPILMMMMVMVIMMMIHLIIRQCDVGLCAVGPGRTL